MAHKRLKHSNSSTEFSTELKINLSTPDSRTLIPHLTLSFREDCSRLISIAGISVSRTEHCKAHSHNGISQNQLVLLKNAISVGLTGSVDPALTKQTHSSPPQVYYSRFPRKQVRAIGRSAPIALASRRFIEQSIPSVATGTAPSKYNVTARLPSSVVNSDVFCILKRRV